MLSCLTGMTSPLKTTFSTLEGTLYSNPFMIETKHMALTAHTSTVGSRSHR